MDKRSFRRGAALAAMVSLLAWAFPSPASDAQAPPERAISCAPHLTETAFALGAGDRIVAADDFSNFPPEAAALPKIGGLYDPNLEKAMALRPDALLLVPSNRGLRDFFSRAGSVRLIECGDANSLASIRETISRLGGVFHREAQAQALLERIDRAFAHIEGRVAQAEAARPAGEAKPSVLMLLARRPGALTNLYAFHADTYLGEQVGRLGFRNAVPADMPLYPQITLEHVLAWNPDVILEVHGRDTLPEDGERLLREDWARLGPLKAAKSPRGVIVLNDKSLTIPGPRVAETFAKLAARLRPDVFPETADELLAEAGKK
jgi:iron complex transport system substrate-binding protein